MTSRREADRGRAGKRNSCPLPKDPVRDGRRAEPCRACRRIDRDGYLLVAERAEHWFVQKEDTATLIVRRVKHHAVDVANVSEPFARTSTGLRPASRDNPERAFNYVWRPRSPRSPPQSWNRNDPQAPNRRSSIFHGIPSVTQLSRPSRTAHDRQPPARFSDGRSSQEVVTCFNIITLRYDRQGSCCSSLHVRAAVFSPAMHLPKVPVLSRQTVEWR